MHSSYTDRPCARRADQLCFCDADRLSGSFRTIVNPVDKKTNMPGSDSAVFPLRPGTSVTSANDAGLSANRQEDLPVRPARQKNGVSDFLAGPKVCRQEDLPVLAAGQT